MNIELLSREAIKPEKLLNLNPVLPAYQKNYEWVSIWVI